MTAQKKLLMKKWINQNKMTLSGIILGATIGFLYWNFVGCANGKCVIKSNPYYMTLYGGLMGGLLLNIFKK